jgi:catechol 2,3-dioxygenase-like lactoylglutathione lyase family enzyme
MDVSLFGNSIIPWEAPMPNLDTTRKPAGAPKLKGAIPILLVRDVTASAEFFEAKLGFEIDFLHGAPPVYGSVSRDGACLHLRYVHEPVFHLVAANEESLICASIETTDVQGLYGEFRSRGAPFAQTPIKQDWGGTDLHIRDLDGNVIAFVMYA